MKSMLSNSKIVTEDYRVEDLLDFDEYTEKIKSKADTAPNKSLFGVVGGYGTGKSVMLEMLKSRMSKDTHWVHFDAWKYPERNNLWEGFVLDFVRQIAPQDFDKVLKQMDGTSKNDVKTLIKTFGTLSNVVFPGSGAAIDKLTYFADTSPAKRVFQIQSIFESLLEKRVKAPVYIIIEDADRSGDAGVYFIETLSQFLREVETEVIIKVFIPIAQKSFFSEKRDAYIKALDYVDFFTVTPRSLTTLVEKIFNPELLATDLVKHHLVEWLQRLIAFYGLTIRDLKFIIRNNDAQYQALQTRGFNPDPRVVLVIESTRLIEESIEGVQVNIYERITRDFKVPSRSQVEMMLYAIGLLASTEQMAEILNEPGQKQSIFRRQVRFIDKVQANTLADIPHQQDNQFTLPLYYLQ